jgi:hypothetical protein
MTCPAILDGGDYLQIWKVVVTVLNKELEIASKGLSFNFGVG